MILSKCSPVAGSEQYQIHNPWNAKAIIQQLHVYTTQDFKNEM